MPQAEAPAPRMKHSGEEVILPPENLDLLLDLARFLEGHPEPAVLVGPDGQQIGMPEEVYRVLLQVIEVMRQGQAIFIAPQGLMLTTQEAGEFLGISRPTLVKLLEDGKIPFEKPNRHRRVALGALLEYQARRREERRSTLNRLTEEAGELGLYDGITDDYASALRIARKRHAQ